MFKRMLALFLLLAGFMPSAAQSPLDAYKYIIVPKKFGFLTEENKFRVNSTTKYLFEKNGFRTLIQGEAYPEDLKRDPCLAATADIDDESNMFITRLYVVLIDCQDQEVFRSVMGVSKEKSYDKTYIDALNKAFISFEEMSYAFDPSLAGNQAAVADVPDATAAVQTKPAAVVPTKPAAAEPTPPVAEPAAAMVPAAVVAVDPTPENETPQKAETLQEAETTEEAVMTAEAETTEVQQENEVSMASSYGNENVSFLLIAQGDKLVAYVSDSKNSGYKKGEVIGTLVKTSLPNVFRASWKNMDKDIDQTTAYFDDQGNLKIDVARGGQIEVLTFVKE